MKCKDCHLFKLSDNAPSAGSKGKIGICSLLPKDQGRAENDDACGTMMLFINVLSHLEALRETVEQMERDKQ